jgi:hypothetical protein
VGVDRAGDRLVRAARLVLVDHGRALAVVAHPRHQILDPRPAGGERVPGVPEIMNVQPLPRSGLEEASPRVAVCTAYLWPGECSVRCGCSRAGSLEALLLAGLVRVQGSEEGGYGAEDAVQDRGRRQLQ